MSTTPTPLPTEKARAKEGDWLLDENTGWTKPETSLFNWVSHQSGYFDDHLPYDQRVRLTMALLRAFDAEMTAISGPKAAPALTTPAPTDTKPTAAAAGGAKQSTSKPQTSPTEGETNGQPVPTESATPTKQPAAKP